LKKLLWYSCYIFLLGDYDFHLQAQSKVQGDLFLSSQQLQVLDRTVDRIYPVTWKKNQIRLMLIPSSLHEQAQSLTVGAYKALQGQDIDTVIVLCETDEIVFHGVLMPLPCVQQSFSLSQDILEKLSKNRLFRYCAQFWYYRGSLQQECFLDYYLKEITVVPLLVGQISSQDAVEIARLLASCCTNQTLIVLVSDIDCYKNCFYDCPLDVSKVCKLYEQDQDVLQDVQSVPVRLQPSLLDVDAYKSPMLALLCEFLQLAQFKNIESYLVGYATSAADSFCMENVETYAAFLFQHHEQGYKNYIGSYEQSQLLQHARRALKSLFELPAQRQPYLVSYEMSQPHGVFSSLYTMSDHGTILRGCMGKTQSKLSLQSMVYQMTQQAAYNDLRFYPLRQRELDSTIISLSVITDIKKVSSYDSICESDGLVLQYDDAIAVSLPPLTPVHNWSWQSALRNLSDQIGAHGSVWKKPRAKIFTFKSLVFQEE